MQEGRKAGPLSKVSQLDAGCPLWMVLVLPSHHTPRMGHGRSNGGDRGSSGESDPCLLLPASLTADSIQQFIWCPLWAMFLIDSRLLGRFPGSSPSPALGSSESFNVSRFPICHIQDVNGAMLPAPCSLLLRLHLEQTQENIEACSPPSPREGPAWTGNVAGGYV